MLFIHGDYTDEPFLMRSPEEIREELDEMRAAVAEADSRISRLQIAKEELENLPISSLLLQVILPELLNKMEDVRDALADMLEETEGLQEELEDTLYVLRATQR